MKVVYYNWVDHDDIQKRGGGVTVYQKNLASHMPAEGTYFISAGVYYVKKSPDPHFTRQGNKFFIYNSGTLAPSHASFGRKEQIYHVGTTNVFIKALEEIGTPDIVHFNNIEGLPVETLYAIKRAFPQTHLIFSVHNYYPFCPQVNLWRKEQSNCIDFYEGRGCTNCVSAPKAFDKQSRRYHRTNFTDKLRPDTSKFVKFFVSLFADVVWTIARRPSRRPNREDDVASTKLPYFPFEHRDLSVEGSFFAQRRANFVKAINDCCSIVLPVSNRVGELCKKYGIDPSLLRTSYIGTGQSHHYDPTKRVAKPVKSIGYLGYMRRDKGFYFFLEAMNRLPRSISEKLTLIVAAKNTDGRAVEEIQELATKFENVIYVDGYTPNTLPSILKKTDLAVVPVLWEDNLPQVAIEANCHNVAVFASDLGGPAEVTGRNPDFTFDAGSHPDFIAKLSKIVSEGITVEGYWKGTMMPINMEQHCEELRGIYQELIIRDDGTTDIEERFENRSSAV